MGCLDFGEVRQKLRTTQMLSTTVGEILSQRVSGTLGSWALFRGSRRRPLTLGPNSPNMVSEAQTQAGRSTSDRSSRVPVTSGSNRTATSFRRRMPIRARAYPPNRVGGSDA